MWPLDTPRQPLSLIHRSTSGRPGYASASTAYEPSSIGQFTTAPSVWLSGRRVIDRAARRAAAALSRVAETRRHGWPLRPSYRQRSPPAGDPAGSSRRVSPRPGFVTPVTPRSLAGQPPVTVTRTGRAPDPD